MYDGHDDPGGCRRSRKMGCAGELPPGLLQSFLTHSASHPAVWQIVTLRDSREALDQMRSSGRTPGGVLMFRAAGAEPALSLFDVAARLSAS